MSLEIFTNNASATLGSALTNTATSITVSTGEGALFPSPTGGQYFSATLYAAGSVTGVPNEIVYVTSRTGDTMTVLRGQEGTTPQSWNVGDNFSNLITAGFLNGLVGPQDSQSQFGNSAVDTGVANAGVITLSPAITSLSAMLYAPIRVKKIASANTGTYTLNVNGLGAKTVILNGVTLQAGQLAAGSIFEVIWDGTYFELISDPALVYNAGLAQMSTYTVKANISGSTAAPSDIPISSLNSYIGFGAYSLSSNGYYTLPNGLIVQWGISTQAALGAGIYTTNFPIAFPNYSNVVISGTTEYGNLGAQNNSPMTYTTTTTGFTWQVNSSCPRAYWHAIGY